MRALSGKVAVVTGASRGIGRGIAIALAAEGATVYVTGRTVTPGSYSLPGTVGETAAEVKFFVPQKSGLIVAISGHVGVTYTYGVVFGTCKSAVDRMARDMAVELKPHNVASLAMWCGLTFTERAHRNLDQNPAMKAQIVTNPQAGSSVEFPGRVIVAMAKDENIMRRSGGTFIAAELAREYGVTDIDGNLPPSLRAQRGAPISEPV
jgi:NAD(P)-dependent dehydrogenase (short-subunit alcohol dehydrogenase family)